MGPVPHKGDDGEDDMFYACDEEELDYFYDPDGSDSPHGATSP